MVHWRNSFPGFSYVCSKTRISWSINELFEEKMDQLQLHFLANFLIVHVPQFLQSKMAAIMPTISAWLRVSNKITEDTLVGVTQCPSSINNLFFFFFFAFSRAAPATYGSSQARGLIRAVAAGLHHSHSNAGSEPCLGPIPQLTATLDRHRPTEQGQGSNPQPHGS